VEISCAKRREKKTYLRVAKDVAERPTELTEGDEETVADQPQSRRRKRIFSTTREHRLERYQSSELYLHETAQKIYCIWRQLLGVLFSSEGDAFVAERAGKHLARLREKAGESIASFKGSWDVDIYCDEEALRNQLAHQLRSQQKDYFSDLHPTAPLPQIANQAFFSSLRPIIFEERAASLKAGEEVVPSEILVFLVHGLGACRLDMEKIKVELKRYFDGKVRVYTSSSNEGRTEGDIDSMGMRLAAEIDYELAKHSNIPKLCLLGHSMGGLIIRSALPRLEKYKQHFHSLITLSSPHLGYAYSASKLVDAGLWFLNAMKKCTSIQQMTMQDHEQPEETFLYKLAHKPGLEWFNKVVFLASHQDLYVPYYSARVQKHEESTLDYRKQVQKGLVYCKMVDSLLGRVQGSITRLNVNFSIPEQYPFHPLRNLDNLIGRAAHISFITNLELVRALVIAGQHYFF
jgi:pimeloyl-ACP methyl ester carboxylesterase